MKNSGYSRLAGFIQIGNEGRTICFNLRMSGNARWIQIEIVAHYLNFSLFRAFNLFFIATHLKIFCLHLYLFWQIQDYHNGSIPDTGLAIQKFQVWLSRFCFDPRDS